MNRDFWNIFPIKSEQILRIPRELLRFLLGKDLFLPLWANNINFWPEYFLLVQKQLGLVIDAVGLAIRDMGL